MKTSAIPTITLERYVLGELSADEMKKMDQLIAENARIARQVAAIRESNKVILQQYTPLTMSQDIRIRASMHSDKHQGRAKFGRYYQAWGTAGVIALSVTLFVVFTPRHHLEMQSIDNPVALLKLEPGIRIKGIEPFLQVFRQTEDHIEQLTSGDLVSEGDVIQLSYVPVSQQYGMIISIDGDGVVTQHLPSDSSHLAKRLEDRVEVRLKNAYELDDAPLFERFYFITSNTAFETQAILEAATQLVSEPGAVLDKSLVLPEHLNYSIFTLNKRSSK